MNVPSFPSVNISPRQSSSEIASTLEDDDAVQLSDDEGHDDGANPPKYYGGDSQDERARAAAGTFDVLADTREFRVPVAAVPKTAGTTHDDGESCAATDAAASEFENSLRLKDANDHRLIRPTSPVRRSSDGAGSGGGASGESSNPLRLSLSSRFRNSAQGKEAVASSAAGAAGDVDMETEGASEEDLAADSEEGVFAPTTSPLPPSPHQNGHRSLDDAVSVTRQLLQPSATESSILAEMDLDISRDDGGVAASLASASNALSSRWVNYSVAGLSFSLESLLLS
jgi:hypothetical protein